MNKHCSASFPLLNTSCDQVLAVEIGTLENKCSLTFESKLSNVGEKLWYNDHYARVLQRNEQKNQYTVVQVFPRIFQQLGHNLTFKQLVNFQIDPGWLMPHVVIIIAALAIRCLATYLFVRGEYNKKERLFITVSWIPKATVQVCRHIFLKFEIYSQFRRPWRRCSSNMHSSKQMDITTS